MREVLFKHLTCLGARKKDISLMEIFQKDGIVARTERRYLYFIREIAHVYEEGEIQRWMEEQKKEIPPKRRHFHILKEHNDELGEERLVCKVAGTFYAVMGRNIYTIAFLHSFKVSLIKATVQGLQ